MVISIIAYTFEYLFIFRLLRNQNIVIIFEVFDLSLILDELSMAYLQKKHCIVQRIAVKF